MSIAPQHGPRFFDAIAHRYDRAYGLPSASSRTRMEMVLRALPPRARVLDLGVGTGRELGALQDAGHLPTGLDFSAEMLALCSRRARPVPLVQADLWRPLPFSDGAFDAVLALHGTLAHPEDEALLARLPLEIARVLAPGGVLVAEVPTPAWLSALDEEPPSRDDERRDLRARRTAPNRCVHEDTVAQVAIEAIFLSDQAWRALLEPTFEVDLQEISAYERRIVAKLVLK